ncbi:MAG: hypothetical protein QOF76_2498 [Solirubrobacteraceae bacterium]|jgi:uncharacterized membrane protein|nr:hypothetical protein [Solirubrobacteraceae bacterium]
MSVADRAPDWLANLMLGIGSTHFVAADMMAKTIPPRLPARKPLVYISGVVEVGCALALRRRLPWAGPITAATLLAIWPANIQMALDAGKGINAGPADNRALMWARVPLQLPLIWAALQARPRV